MTAIAITSTSPGNTFEGLPLRPASERSVIASDTDRLEAMMARYLGSAVVAAFANDDVTEIYTNPHDRIVRLDTRTRGRVVTDVHLPPDRVVMFLDCVAVSAGVTLGPDRPTLAAELPVGRFRKARVQGFVPPIVAGPAFAIRKPPTVIYPLHEYVAHGTLRPVHLAALREAVRHRNNILIAGGTNSGKTTFANALIAEIAVQCPNDRLVILEDTVELQCASPDHLALRAQPTLSLRALVKATLRASPNRIIVGEVRDESALDLLDAWATGHPGGIATCHATDALGALHRLDRLAQRANVPSQRALIAAAIDVVVVLAHTMQGRCVTDVVRVTGLDGTDGYHLESLSPLPSAAIDRIIEESPQGFRLPPEDHS